MDVLLPERRVLLPSGIVVGHGKLMSSRVFVSDGHCLEYQQSVPSGHVLNGRSVDV